MLIHVNKNYYARGKTGKGKFAARLVRAWREMGIEITEDPKVKADIALHIGRMNYLSKAKKHVLRVGPACINTNMNWRKINHEKAQSVKKADAIVYQSRYSKKIYHKLVYYPNKPEMIIFNGADPKEYDVEPYESRFDYNFLASTRVWLKQKRLKQTIKAFLDASISFSQLIICGDTQGINKKYIDKKNILFLGNVDDYTLARIYKLCDAMIHITYIDAFPNSVVEAQVADLPVICGDQGGTHEGVKNFGVILKDKPFNYKPIDLNKPPKLNHDKLIWAIRQAVEGDYVGGYGDKIESLYIETIAKQYLGFFENIL